MLRFKYFAIKQVKILSESHQINILLISVQVKNHRIVNNHRVILPGRVDGDFNKNKQTVAAFNLNISIFIRLNSVDIQPEMRIVASCQKNLRNQHRLFVRVFYREPFCC